jgi:sRNA-binding carbon storage regulator CsrA
MQKVLLAKSITNKTMSNLILTRRRGDSVILYDKERILCKVTVESTGPKQTKLVFDAIPSIKIDRQEIYKVRNSTDGNSIPQSDPKTGQRNK